MSRHRARSRRPAAAPPGRVCDSTGKVRYGDEVGALTALSDMAVREKRGQQRDRTDGLVPYRCGDCGGWHLGRR